MGVIHLELFTHISAPPARCFDISRSIDAHVSSLRHTGERAVAGRTQGLIQLHETVTWEARHFGLKLRMTVSITEMQPPHYFCDEQVKGPFAMLRHQHFFETHGTQTLMRDVFECAAPLGILGRMAEFFFLKKYMTKLLTTRNESIKRMAEAGAEKPGE
ncbi:MAG: SRPBCC family protein [Bacteroidia bacterium]|nr:SRPBCC family protein [Bacteroidia bacterium]